MATQTAQRKPPRKPKTATGWDGLAIETAVRDLEGEYGVPDPKPRFEPMDELISCILTQHTSDANAYPAFERMKAAFPTWENVAAAGTEKLADVVRSAGLANQKAKNILACLREIKVRNSGYSLENLRTEPMAIGRDWLTSLPGVGPKTASIVLSFAFGKEAIPVDTHVYRVSARLGFIPAGCGEAKAHDLLLEVVPNGLAFRFHVALIRHGREVCKAPMPQCESCVLRDRCAFFLQGGLERRKQEIVRARAARRKGAAPKVNKGRG